MKKLAYQIGVQGYALMNDRAFCNCQRIKKANTTSGWEAWESCWTEYKDAYNNMKAFELQNDTFLSKYLSQEDVKSIKTSSSQIKNIKDGLIQEIDGLAETSKYVGASIRNSLRRHAHNELANLIEDEDSNKG